MDATSQSPSWDERIASWAEARNIVDGSTPRQQFGKLMEEVNELSEAIHEMEVDTCSSDVWYAAMQDAIGDCAVVLQVIAEMVGTSLTECQELAWAEIKDRKGRMVDGVFVKEV